MCGLKGSWFHALHFAGEYAVYQDIGSNIHKLLFCSPNSNSRYQKQFSHQYWMHTCNIGYNADALYTQNHYNLWKIKSLTTESILLRIILFSFSTSENDWTTHKTTSIGSRKSFQSRKRLWELLLSKHRIHYAYS